MSFFFFLGQSTRCNFVPRNGPLQGLTVQLCCSYGTLVQETDLLHTKCPLHATLARPIKCVMAPRQGLCNHYQTRVPHSHRWQFLPCVPGEHTHSPVAASHSPECRQSRHQLLQSTSQRPAAQPEEVYMAGSFQIRSKLGQPAHPNQLKSVQEGHCAAKTVLGVKFCCVLPTE